MLHEYNAGTIELCGEDYPAEVDYEIDDGKVIVHSVYAIKIHARKDEIYYDKNGIYHLGPYSTRLNITPFLGRDQIQAWEEEIGAYLEFMNAEAA